MRTAVMAWPLGNEGPPAASVIRTRAEVGRGGGEPDGEDVGEVGEGFREVECTVKGRGIDLLEAMGDPEVGGEGVVGGGEAGQDAETEKGYEPEDGGQG